MAHLQPLRAIVNQPFAALLFVLTTGAFAVAVSEVVDPRGRWGLLARWAGPRETTLALSFLGLMTLGWFYKIWMMSA